MLDINTYNVKEDLEVKKILNYEELSEYTISTYCSVLKQFVEAIKKPYFEIVSEIKELQRDKIVGNEIIRYNPNDSLINDYIHIFIHFLGKRGNKKSSINLKVKQLIILLKKSNIETPEFKFKQEATQKKVQLITSDDIKFILNNSNIHHKAMISFLASTGIRRYDLIHTFKIEDYIEACSDYTNAVSLDEFMEESPKNMIPYFEFIPNKTKKTGLPCKVCCSAESSNLILESIRLRLKSIKKHNREKDDDLELTEEHPLFASKKRNYLGEFDDASVSGIFYRKNKLFKEYKENEIDNLLNDKKISKKEWKHKKENIPKFHPHSLRYRFISTLRAYTTNRDISLLMEGHASSINTDKYYIGESEELFNKETIRQTYLQVMPYLTFGVC